MMRGALTSHLDVAQVVLYAFWIFFAGLVFYLRREDRREGYPLESESMNRTKARGFLLIPTPKIFRLAHGGSVSAPRFDVDPRAINAVKTAPWPGAPLEPVGDPMLAGVGPGAYALRADVAEKTHDGRDLIVPMRVASNFTVATEDSNPIGMAVVGADRKVAGVVTDIWVDRAESMARYYEVDLGPAADPRRILLPVTFSRVNAGLRRIHVEALLSSQFAAVPVTQDPDRITMLEEEKVTAYFGAGTLYATRQRTEPML